MSEFEPKEQIIPDEEKVIDFSGFIGDVLLAGVTKVEIAERFDVGIPIVDGWMSGKSRPQLPLEDDVVNEYGYLLTPDIQ